MEKKQRSKKCKKLQIDLNKEFHPKIPIPAVSAKQKWQPFGPFPCVLPPPLSPPSTYSVPAKNLVFGDLQPFRGASPTTASDGTPATNDLETLPLLPTSSWKRCEIPSHQLAPSTMTIFYSGSVSAFHDISPEKVELVLGMAGSEEIEEKRWNENPSFVYATDETTTAPSSSSGSFYQNFAPGAIAMARKATLARFLEKRKHRLIHNKAYLQDGKVLPDLSL
ncbi:PREDICTED: protein TIFY 7-like isoform X2 [Ipomoea nil]|uniref:protein TIFY 7-like isoform X2 n=1 Tax=Ipomoea nil TaxID=35883 RepID=UPI0009014F13|nr:PREDICTED: protein TIFY 7-like isoform X2 [Ipomoea nil]